MNNSNINPDGNDDICRLRSPEFIKEQITRVTRYYPFDPDAVSSAVHDACATVEMLILSGKKIENLGPYVRVCAANQLRKEHRRERKRRKDCDLNHVASAPDEQLLAMENEEMIAKLRAVLPRLSELPSKIIHLHFFDALSPEEIASQLGISRSSVYQKLKESLNLLRIWLL
jgi:RNA polymerase sigma factor (sigma-70 family)